MSEERKLEVVENEPKFEENESGTDIENVGTDSGVSEGTVEVDGEVTDIVPAEDIEEVDLGEAGDAPGEVDLSNLGALGGLGALLGGMMGGEQQDGEPEEEKEPEHVTLEEKRAMIMMPKDAVEVVLTATIFENGALTKVSKTISNEDVQKAFMDADMNYVEDNDRFVLTDKAEEELSEGWEK